MTKVIKTDEKMNDNNNEARGRQEIAGGRQSIWYQEGSPQGRLATGRFATALEGSPQLWKVRHKCHGKVRHNVRMHYNTVKMKLYFETFTEGFILYYD